MDFDLNVEDILQIMNEVMLDLETVSVRPNAAIVIIGAVKFSRKGSLEKLEHLDSFYRRIDINSCVVIGMDVDKKTLDWWKQQDKAALYEALENPNRISIKQALEEFSKWFGNSQYVWGNGDDFDCTILGEAFTRAGLQIPWKFWNTRDCRTLFDLGNVRMKDLPDNDKHNAIADCYRQIIGVKKALANLKL